MNRINQQELATKPILLMLHGWAMHSAVWQNIVPVLQQSFEIILIDLPGHGKHSTVECQSDSIESWCESIKQLLDHALLERDLSSVQRPVHIVGWSLGGLVAQVFARQYPEEVASLFLVGSSPCFAQRPDWECAMDNQILENFSKSLVLQRAKTIKRFWALQTMGMKSSAEIKQVRDAVLSGNVNESCLVTGLDFLKNIDCRALNFQQPVHWYLGGKDTLVPRTLSAVLAQLHPQHDVFMNANAGHIPFLTHPDQFIDQLTTWVNHHA